MKKVPFVKKEQIEEIVKTYPTPFHIYDEKGIRENAKALKEAFAWNPGYKEFFYSRELERETALFVYEDDFADYNRGETDDDCTLTHVYECGAVVKLCDKAAGKRNERI